MMPAEADHSLTKPILLVEDHPDLRALIQTQLSQRRYLVHTAANGLQALSCLANHQYQAVILDLGLPDIDGMQLLAQLPTQPQRLPCLVLTARDAVASRIQALKSGADDYLLKPFDAGELEARLDAILRRSHSTRYQRLHIANLSFEPESLQAWVDQKPLRLPRRETMLLEELLRATPRILIKDVVIDRLYTADQTISLNAIEALISRLRRKLEQAQAAVRIDTVRGIGYRLQAL